MKHSLIIHIKEKTTIEIEFLLKLDPKAIESAAQFIESAEAIMIGAGAGMGVDSGLPDFRAEGFWRAYPQLEELGVSFEEMANPQWFEKNPRLAWGFYGHHLNCIKEPNHTWL